MLICLGIKNCLLVCVGIYQPWKAWEAQSESQDVIQRGYEYLLIYLAKSVKRDYPT